MAESDTARFGLRHWTAGTDTPSRAEIDGSLQAIETLAVKYGRGLLADRPLASAAWVGGIYEATDAYAVAARPALYWCDGADWHRLRFDHDAPYGPLKARYSDAAIAIDAVNRLVLEVTAVPVDANRLIRCEAVVPWLRDNDGDSDDIAFWWQRDTAAHVLWGYETAVGTPDGKRGGVRLVGWDYNPPAGAHDYQLMATTDAGLANAEPSIGHIVAVVYDDGRNPPGNLFAT